MFKKRAPLLFLLLT